MHEGLDTLLPATLPTTLSTAHLAYLVAIDGSRTWADAARTLGVTPSALSQGIAELERRLGTELFGWAGRRRVALAHTPEVVRYARQVLGDTADLRSWLARVTTGQIGRFRLGMIDAAAVDHFSGVVRDFRAGRPDLEVRITVAPTGELLDLLTEGHLDLAVCVDPDGEGMFDARPLVRDDLALYAPPELRAGLDTPPATWGPWLAFPPSSRTRQAIDRCLRALGAPVAVVMESHQPEVLREMVRVGLGWSVLPVVQAERAPGALTRVRPEPLLRRTISAVTRRGRPVHPAALELTGQLVRVGADAG